MLPRDPEDWPSLFAQHLNAGDLEKVLSLYEPDARFVAPSGETLGGRDRIGEVIAALIRSNTKFQDNRAQLQRHRSAPAPARRHLEAYHRRSERAWANCGLMERISALAPLL